MTHCDIPVVPLVGYRICTFYARHAKALKQDQKTHNYLQQTLNLSNARVEMSTPNERDLTNKKVSLVSLVSHWLMVRFGPTLVKFLNVGILRFLKWKSIRFWRNWWNSEIVLKLGTVLWNRLLFFWGGGGERGGLGIWVFLGFNFEEMCVPGWLMLNYVFFHRRMNIKKTI